MLGIAGFPGCSTPRQLLCPGFLALLPFGFEPGFESMVIASVMGRDGFKRERGGDFGVVRRVLFFL